MNTIPKVVCLLLRYLILALALNFVDRLSSTLPILCQVIFKIGSVGQTTYRVFKAARFQDYSSILSNLRSSSCASSQVLVDLVKPEIELMRIVSSNSHPILAMAGDTVTLEFTSTEDLRSTLDAAR